MAVANIVVSLPCSAVNVASYSAFWCPLPPAVLKCLTVGRGLAKVGGQHRRFQVSFLRSAPEAMLAAKLKKREGRERERQKDREKETESRERRKEKKRNRKREKDRLT